MPIFHDLATYVFHFLQIWAKSISNPVQFLEPVFQPTESTTISALEFYIATITFSFILQSPFVLGQKAELGEKARLAATSLVGLVSSAVVAMAWHFAFSWLGGTASFAGTCVAYVYGGAPYIPLMALASLAAFAGLPADIQAYALAPNNPKSAAAMRKGMDDPRTKKGLVALGGLSLVGLALRSAWVQLRSMSFVHAIAGLRFFGAVVVCLIIMALLLPFLQAIASVFHGPGTDVEMVANATPSTQPVGTSGT